MPIWCRDQTGREIRRDQMPKNNMVGREEDGQMHFQLHVLDKASAPPRPFMQDYLNST